MQTLRELTDAVEAALADNLPSDSDLDPRLVRAMRYSVLGGGKRIRPLLTCAVATGFGASLESALLPACAVEYIHAYSLIHDDLPCMDDDDLRRGQPSCHRAFDEATAVLAGDALQSLAFELLQRATGLDPELRLEMLAVLSRAAGHAGMVGGQALDMRVTGDSSPDLSLADLEKMHGAKTGALISASVRLGALTAGRVSTPHLDSFSQRLGLAFQVVDDLLDVTGSTASLGKTAGADAAQGKATFPGIVGVTQSREIAVSLRAAALEDLTQAGLESEPLLEIVDWVVVRER